MSAPALSSASAASVCPSRAAKCSAVQPRCVREETAAESGRRRGISGEGGREGWGVEGERESE
eukprot:3648413-Rhodomonas_salina.1